MRPPIRAAIRFSVILAALTAVVLFAQHRWPEYDVAIQLSVYAAYIVYFIWDTVRQDRARQSA
jgi:hypothetical protein